MIFSGAHIAGSAGKAFQESTSGKLLPRITGFDPAKVICMQENFEISFKLLQLNLFFT